MEHPYEKILADVATDRQSGAWLIARKTIRCIKALAKELSQASIDDLCTQLERVIREILAAQPGMAQLINLFNILLVTIAEDTSDDVVVLSRRISGDATRFGELAEKAVTKVADLGAGLIDDNSTVLVHSNSSTVLEVIKKAQENGKTFQVIQSESRPICEGKASTGALSDLGIASVYLTDAAIGHGVERADLVLLGADSLSEHTLVNKVGSKAICLLSREAIVPCYAACESSKFIPGKLRPKKEKSRDFKEVWAEPPVETTVENYYFDDIPIELFSEIITEEGILRPTQIGERIKTQTMSPKLLDMLK